jgi:hypothetical protein
MGDKHAKRYMMVVLIGRLDKICKSFDIGRK